MLKRWHLIFYLISLLNQFSFNRYQNFWNIFNSVSRKSEFNLDLQRHSDAMPPCKAKVPRGQWVRSRHGSSGTSHFQQQRAVPHDIGIRALAADTALVTTRKWAVAPPTFGPRQPLFELFTWQPSAHMHRLWLPHASVQRADVDATEQLFIRRIQQAARFVN